MFGDKVEVVVAQYHPARIAEIAQKAQGVEGARAAINEIAHAPELILARVEVDFFEELAKGFVTALNISNYIGAHIL